MSGDASGREGGALCAVFAENMKQLRSTAHKVIRRRDVAEEIVQDAYVKIRGAPANCNCRSPLVYCHNVVRNLAIDRWRRRGREAHLFMDEDSAGVEAVSSSCTPERAAMTRQILVLVDAALEDLPARTRRAFEMHRLEGMTQREIAGRLGVSATLVNFMIRDASAAVGRYRHLMGDD